MPINSEIFISNTSCLIILSKIDEIELLNKLCDNVFTTSVVQNEFHNRVPDWIKIKDPPDAKYQEILEMEVDKGEASVIALALKLERSILIIDDLKGRRVADNLNLKYSGTFGLLLKAKEEGIINKITPIINKILTTNFRFSEELIQTIIREAGEL
jgi:predicted nucleic acid-binding protein